MNNRKITEHITEINYLKPRCIVLIPSILLGGYSQHFLKGLRHYEERYLYFLAFLKNPNTHFIAVLTKGLDPALLEYFFCHIKSSFCITDQDIKKRFQIIWVKDSKGKTLTQSILRNEKTIHQIRAATAGRGDRYIEFWRVSSDEISLSKQLKMPYFGLQKSALTVNTKSGARKLFSKLGIPISKGYYCVSLKDAHNKLQQLVSETTARSFLLKMNDEGGGVGIFQLLRDEVMKSYSAFRVSLPLPKEQPLEVFERYFKKEGGVVEEFIESEATSSPSVQFEISPNGSIRNISTHDQIIEGVDYVGTRFPANENYRRRITVMGHKVAREMQKMGAAGFVAMDFLVTHVHGKQKVWGIEINARKGGANHTNLWTKYLTGAHYNAKRGILESDKGDVYYRASEYFINKPWLKDISPVLLLTTIKNAGLDFNARRKEGVFVHLLSPLRLFGKFGVTVIAHSSGDVERYWKKLENTITSMSH